MMEHFHGQASLNNMRLYRSMERTVIYSALIWVYHKILSPFLYFFKNLLQFSSK